MEKDYQTMDCPYCESDVEVDIEFAIKNERVFCGTCCKAFDVKIKARPKKVEEKKEEPKKEIPEGLPNKDSKHYKWEEEAKEKDDTPKFPERGRGYYDWDGYN